MSFDKITDKLRLWRMTKEALVNHAQQLEQDNKEMLEALNQIAAIMHHGGLMGYKSQPKAMIAAAKLSLPYWDKEEANRLQVESTQEGE